MLYPLHVFHLKSDFMSLERALQLLQAIEDKKNSNKIDFYQPYQFQKDFHNAVGFNTVKPADQKVLLAGNQCGKSFCAAMEVAIHATGMYPPWWRGQRFNKPVEIIIGSNTNESGRDICQKELFGLPEDENALGTGAIPKNKIGAIAKKPGVNNAFDTVMVKHPGGWSRIQIKAYEQGFKKFMGIRCDIGWPDEEPPMDIWVQFQRATFSKKQSLLLVSMTPEEGMTKLVTQFMNDPQKGQAIIKATWDDAPHMTKEMQEQKLATIPEYQRDMRAKGIPLLGSGVVFPVKEEDIKVEGFEIPAYWPQIWGVDFGIDHPFAAVRVAWDRDADIIYVVDCYRAVGATPPIHASSMKSRGDWIPVAWPHDGLNREKSSGIPLAELYRKENLEMLHNKFSNPPGAGQEEGEGGNSVEFGIMDILNRMKTGRFKVFSHLNDWWSEFRLYHRNNGKIVAVDDDIMSATRYAALSIRHAKTFTMPDYEETYWRPSDSITGY